LAGCNRPTGSVMHRSILIFGRIATIGLAVLGLAACQQKHAGTDANTKAETADEFVARVNREMLEIGKELNAAQWVQQTYITDDTQMLSAKANERYLEYFSHAVEQAKHFDAKQVSHPDTARALELLKLGVAASIFAPAPS